jgi:recombination protein RecT
MSQLVKLDDRAKALEMVFRTNMGAMSKVVPRTMGDPSRLLRIAYNNIAYDTKLLECSATPQGMISIFGGVMECLKLGLMIGGPMQEAWLIPFKVKGIPTATVIIGYQGYRNILDRGKSVIDLHPVAVYAQDEFDFELGSRPYVKHKPNFARQPPLIAVYAVAHLPRGGIQIEVMGKAEVDEHRAKSRASSDGPWVDYYEAMALKTVVRKIAKYLPKSSEILARALDLDDRADRGVDQSLDMEGLVFDMGGPPMKQVGGTRLDALKKELGTGSTAPPSPIPPLQAEPSFESQPVDVTTTVEQELTPAQREQWRIVEERAEIKRQQWRIMEERAEIERLTEKMKAAETGPRAAPPPPAKPIVMPEGFEPAAGTMFPGDEPIGPERAKAMLEQIRQAAAPKAKR